MKKIIALALVLLITFPAAPAHAHAQLTGATPKANAILTKAPAQVTLTFDDELIVLGTSNQLQVTNSQRQRVDKNDALVFGNQLTVSLKKLVTGKYKIAYRVISSDGHPVSGSYSFTVKQPTKK